MKKKIKIQYDGTAVFAAMFYLFALSAALMYVWCRSQAVICTIIMTALCCGIYFLFYKVRTRKLISFLTFTGIFIVVYLLFAFASNPYRSPAYWEFLFTTSNFFDPFYAAVTIAVFSLIVTFPVCYFTAYLPRPGFLLLPAYIPLILGARTLGGLPEGILLLLVIGFVAAAMGTSRAKSTDTVYFEEKTPDKGKIIALSTAALAVSLVFFVLPRVNNTPYLDWLNTVLRGRTSIYGRQSLTNFSESSIPNRGNNNPTTDSLFVVSAMYPQNVIRWSFDIYEGNDGWSYDENYSMGYADWESSSRRLSFKRLVDSLKQGVSEGKLEKYREEITALDAGESYPVQMTVRVTDGSSTAVVLHPNRTTGVSITNLDENTYRNPKDEIFTKENMGKNASYLVSYLAEPVNESFVNMLERVDFSELLNDAYSEGVIDYITFNAFDSEYDSAMEYYSDNGFKELPVSERSLYDPKESTARIQALADEITAGLTTDYEKALAIEKWFGGAGFVYDMDFVPREATAEYFLFESRRGICTDFATASTLLLRAAGIPARYTEGFVLSEDSMDLMGRYVVTPEQAHAFSTAYIEGAGWIEIDGTRFAETADSGEALRWTVFIIIAAAGILTVLGIIFRKPISEAVFAVGYQFKNKENKIRAVYLRTRKLVCKIPDIDPKSATAEEVRGIIARSLRLEKEADEITSAANELMYGGKTPEISGKQLYKDYKAVYRMKRSMKK